MIDHDDQLGFHTTPYNSLKAKVVPSTLYVIPVYTPMRGAGLSMFYSTTKPSTFILLLKHLPIHCRSWPPLFSRPGTHRSFFLCHVTPSMAARYKLAVPGPDGAYIYAVVLYLVRILPCPRLGSIDVRTAGLVSLRASIPTGWLTGSSPRNMVKFRQ